MADERAVSSVVGAMLMLAVLMTMLSVFHSYYVPEWKAGLEYDHLSDVQMQFLELKSTLDSHLSMGSGITTSSPIELGGGGLPFISPVRSGGAIMVKPENGGVLIIAGSPKSSSTGTIAYRSSNNFWLDQSFVYDNSAVLMTQDNSTVMRVEPMVLYTQSDSCLTLHTINITTPSGENSSMSGNGIATIDVKKVNTSVLYSGNCSDVSLLRIYTPYPHQWAQFFNGSENLAPALSVSEESTYIELTPDCANVSTLYVDVSEFMVDVR
ncbi:MAG: DUF7289 family protein [Methermicoccaceae archaeon]